ncbi:hypothetical protein C9I50_12445 [Pseudomonas prosekii]|nr:hypothetical protein C9I50_12445 [Pseudomonas prosekii]
MLAMASGQPISMLNDTPLSRASSAPTGGCVGSANISVEWQTAFASKLSSYRGWGWVSQHQC